MRWCWTLTAALGIALAGALYVFLIRGSVAPADDGRTAILLPQAERNLVLAEMRSFLLATQSILLDAERGDLGAAAKAARAVGSAAQHGVPASLIGRLPLDFKRLGFATHAAFDQLAMDAESLGDRDQTLKALGDLMARCLACHAAYRIDPVQP